MPALPQEIIVILQQFAPFFSRRVWRWVQVLVVGAILAPGKRTVSSVLRVMGLSHEVQFQRYHRVLNRACWSSRALSRTLLRLLVKAFVPPGEPVVVGIDETIERRRGEQIAAKGIYRDAVRSSHSHFVKASGLRWVSMMLLVSIPWAGRVWALPFLSALAPSERYYQTRHRQPKKVTDWARQLILQLRRWLPDHRLVVVADSSYAALALLARCATLVNPVTMITRLRLDAALYDLAPVHTKRPVGRPRRKGQRQPTLAQRLAASDTQWETLTVPWYGKAERVVEVATGCALWFHSGMPAVSIRWVLIRDPRGRFKSQALLCTDQEAMPLHIIGWFVQRWQLEVTFEEVRAHLGVESQRQWNDLAILRTTPALLALFSFVTLVAHQLLQGERLPARQAAWYTKDLATFSDTLAFLRYQLWPTSFFAMSSDNTDVIKIPRTIFNHLTEMLAFAA